MDPACSSWSRSTLRTRIRSPCDALICTAHEALGLLPTLRQRPDRHPPRPWPSPFPHVPNQEMPFQAPLQPPFFFDCETTACLSALSSPSYPLTFSYRRRSPCYFNTGVMVMDLNRWRAGDYTRRLEFWMEIQKKEARIYELGSLPPFLLVFAGEVKGVDHRWNQHGLSGDNVQVLCRDLHPGPVSLLHWSSKGKPWLRLDAGRPCPLDALWTPYDLLRRKDSVLQPRRRL